VGTAATAVRKKIQDSTDDIFSFSVQGIDLDSMRERARIEAARFWNVSSRRVKVHLSNIHVAMRDPFPTDLNTFAAVDALGAFAKCILEKDPDMPSHEDL
jgi:hypothetical protein